VARTPEVLHRETEPVLTERDAELRLIELINEERLAAGLIMLKEHKELRKLARSHARDMFEAGFAAHVSPGKGDLGDRAEKQGVKFLLIGENIALSPTIRGAHRNLMDSPAHRGNIVDPRFRYIGVGVTRSLSGEGQVQYWIAQEFADLQ
jgi:uncharacterized protein YkwD